MVFRVNYTSCYRYLESAADGLVQDQAGLVDLDRVLQDDRVSGAVGQLSSSAEVADGHRVGGSDEQPGVGPIDVTVRLMMFSTVIPPTPCTTL